MLQPDGSDFEVLPLSASMCQLLIPKFTSFLFGCSFTQTCPFIGNGVISSLLLFPKFCLLVSFMHWEVMTSSVLWFIFIYTMNVFKLGGRWKTSTLGDYNWSCILSILYILWSTTSIGMNQICCVLGTSMLLIDGGTACIVQNFQEDMKSIASLLKV